MPPASRVKDQANCPSDGHCKPCCSHGVIGGPLLWQVGSAGTGTDIDPNEALLPGVSPKPKQEKSKQENSGSTLDRAYEIKPPIIGKIPVSKNAAAVRDAALNANGCAQ